VFGRRQRGRRENEGRKRRTFLKASPNLITGVDWNIRFGFIVNLPC
jgi:hypothetical protein